jgi:YVTN family beta-propeller protein
VLALLALTACHGSAHGPRAAVSNEDDGTVSVIDLARGATIATIPVGKRPRGMQVSGNRLYVALSGSPKGGPNVDESTLPPPDRSADGIGVVDLDQLVLLQTIQSGQDPESFALIEPDTHLVSNEETGEASIVAIGSREVKARIPVGGEPEGVATAPDGTVWVTSEAEGTVAVIDPASARVITKIKVGQRPRSVAFTKSLAIVTGELDASVTLVDLASRTVRTRIELPPIGDVPARPMGVVVSKDGTRAFVTTGRAGAVAVIDLDAQKVIDTITDVGKRPWGIAIGRDGLVYTANGPSNDVTAIDPKTGKVVRHIAAGRSPWGIVSL